MIVINLDVMLAKRKMRSNELAEMLGITKANLSILKTGKAKAIRLSTLNKLCRILNCTPADLLEYREDEENGERNGEALNEVKRVKTENGERRTENGMAKPSTKRSESKRITKKVEEKN